MFLIFLLPFILNDLIRHYSRSIQTMCSRDYWIWAGQYPYFINDFAVNILGTSPLSDTSEQAFFAFPSFYQQLCAGKRFTGSEIRFIDRRDDPIEEGLQKGFQYIRYYFPKYNLPPKVVSYIGPFDAPGVALTRYHTGHRSATICRKTISLFI